MTIDDRAPHGNLGGPAPFTRLGPATFLAQPTAEGPWTPGFCHGGAPAALVAHVADAVAVAVPMQIARITVNLLRPVPVEQLQVSTHVIREGRNIQIIDANVHDGEGRLVTRAEVLRVRQGSSAEIRNFPDCDFPPAHTGVVTRPPTGVGFSRLFEMRAVRGRFETPGPASVWFRMSGALVHGEDTSPVTRAIACADFASGIGTTVPFSGWTYPNADLTVSFARAPRDGWLLLDADCWIGDEGRGVAAARIGDVDGWFGMSTQSTLVTPRRDGP